MQIETQSSRSQIVDLAQSVKDSFLQQVEEKEGEAKEQFVEELIQKIEEETSEEVILEESLTEQEVAQEEM